MDLNLEQPIIGNEKGEIEVKIPKRKNDGESEIESNKKLKINEEESNKTIKTEGAETKSEKQNNIKSPEKAEQISQQTPTKVPISPKKRLELPSSSDVQKSIKKKFIYGNYSQYYGYRNMEKHHHDVRLDVFAEHAHLFKDKLILDIGCNSGFITMEIAKKFAVKSIVGLDIDKSLINQAVKNLTKLKKSFPMENELKRQHKFPFNVTFVHGNYVLKDDVLLEIERPKFDVILFLSITKWIHLNFSDKGLKQSFKRIFAQLKPQGMLILEAQPFDNYGRRKKMTDTIYKNFKDIKFFPKDFTEYLLSSDVGFSKVELMGVPEHCTKGFKRPIHIFFKT